MTHFSRFAQCSKVGGNLNQLARHFNSGGADTEQIRAKILDKLADLTASEKAKFYEQYKEAKEELFKLKTAKQNVASFFREEEPAQQERRCV